MTADISVIIAAYNVEKYIVRAVRSALDQEGAEVEVIVVNDASTDYTATVIEELNDARVRLIKLPTNGGPAAARNVAIEAATAPWIAVLDGDDEFLPQRLFRCLMRAKAVDADIIVDNLEAYREEDGTSRPMFSPLGLYRYSLLDLAAFIGHNRNSPGGGEAYGYLKPIFKTDFLRRNNLRYDEELRIGEDYMLMIEALVLGARCAVEPSMGYRYTVRAGSISHRLALDDIERMAAGDRKFLMRYTLDPAANAAQNKRNKGLRDAAAFTRIVSAIKQQDFKAIMRAVIARPFAVRFLWRPVWVRIEKLYKQTFKRRDDE